MRLWRDPAVRFVVGSVVASFGLVGAAVGLGASAPGGVSEPPESTIPMVAEETCAEPDGSYTDLRECLSPSVVFIETPLGIGTGVLLSTGEIVTNAHVVDPFEAVDVTFVGGRKVSDVRVLGTIIRDDIAVLEAVGDVTGGVTLGPLPSFVTASSPEVFLVGFPGGFEDDGPEVTISRGVLARLRANEWSEQVWLQSDALIAGGQSGGALVTADGRLLGISGYTAYGFSFSLSADDVIEALSEIRSGNQSERNALPTEIEEWEEKTKIESPSPGAVRRIYIPATKSDRVVSVDVSYLDYSLTAYTADGEALGTYRDFDQPSNGYDDDYYFDDYDYEKWYSERDGSPFSSATLELNDDGAVEIAVPGGELAILELALGRRGTPNVTIDVPYLLLDGVAQGDDMKVGDTASGIVDSIDHQTAHEIDLEEGDEIVVTVSGSPVVPQVSLLSRDDDPLDSFNVFASRLAPGETGLGLLDGEAERSYVINKSGTFTLIVSSALGTEYEIEVERNDD